jgi:hypothetical protein
MTPLTPSELMKLPLEERNRIVKASFELAADEEFEIFEAFGDEEREFMETCDYLIDDPSE